MGEVKGNSNAVSDRSQLVYRYDLILCDDHKIAMLCTRTSYQTMPESGV
jgi:hypothetical protein